jgi:hypothetical protein
MSTIQRICNLCGDKVGQLVKHKQAQHSLSNDDLRVIERWLSENRRTETND